jgi:hypothetical protein
MNYSPTETLADLRKAIASGRCGPGIRDVLEDAIRTIETTISAAARITTERDIAIKETSRWAAKAGEWQGKYEMSTSAGILEGWKERAKAAERELAKLRDTADGGR